MKAIIIAAGMGTRLSGISGKVPKPLTPLCGKPIIAHIIESCKNAGVTDFGIVTGYMGEKIQEYLQGGSDLGIRVDYIYNPDWRKANGISALKAETLVEGEDSFLLLMSDHLFNARMLSGIISDPQETNLLAVDKNIAAIFDLPDATKVLCENTEIKNIGKEIPQYNGIDCGMFRLKQNFFSALREAIAEGRDQLSNGIQKLIDKNDFRAHFIDVKSHWLDVDTEDAFAHAESQLFLYR